MGENLPCLFEWVREGSCCILQGAASRGGNLVRFSLNLCIKHYMINKKTKVYRGEKKNANHVLSSDCSEVIVVGAGADAVDYKLISICHKGDIVVSQDYGVAAMALGKGVYAIHQSGRWYTNDNIDQMLMERYLNKKARRSSHKNHIKGPKKRTSEDDERFAQSFEKMILMAKEKEDFENCER